MVTVSIHHRNVKALATEMFKAKKQYFTENCERIFGT